MMNACLYISKALQIAASPELPTAAVPIDGSMIFFNGTRQMVPKALSEFCRELKATLELLQGLTGHAPSPVLLSTEFPKTL